MVFAARAAEDTGLAGQSWLLLRAVHSRRDVQHDPAGRRARAESSNCGEGIVDHCGTRRRKDSEIMTKKIEGLQDALATAKEEEQAVSPNSCNRSM